MYIYIHISNIVWLKRCARSIVEAFVSMVGRTFPVSELLHCSIIVVTLGWCRFICQEALSTDTGEDRLRIVVGPSPPPYAAALFLEERCRLPHLGDLEENPQTPIPEHIVEGVPNNRRRCPGARLKDLKKPAEAPQGAQGIPRYTQGGPRALRDLRRA